MKITAYRTIFETILVIIILILCWQRHGQETTHNKEISDIETHNGFLQAQVNEAKSQVEALQAQKQHLQVRYQDSFSRILSLPVPEKVKWLAKNIGADTLRMITDTSIALPTRYLDTLNITNEALEYARSQLGLSDSIITVQSSAIAKQDTIIQGNNKIIGIQAQNLTEANKKAAKMQLQRNVLAGIAGVSILLLLLK